MCLFVGMKEADTVQLSIFELLNAFRTDVFDEPAIAVRRVLQTGQAYEHELQFTERNETLGLRISLVLDDSKNDHKDSAASLPGCGRQGPHTNQRVRAIEE